MILWKSKRTGDSDPNPRNSRSFNDALLGRPSGIVPDVGEGEETDRGAGESVGSEADAPSDYCLIDVRTSHKPSHTASNWLLKPLPSTCEFRIQKNLYFQLND